MATDRPMVTRPLRSFPAQCGRGTLLPRERAAGRRSVKALLPRTRSATRCRAGRALNPPRQTSAASQNASAAPARASDRRSSTAVVAGAVSAGGLTVIANAPRRPVATPALFSGWRIATRPAPRCAATHADHGDGLHAALSAPAPKTVPASQAPARHHGSSDCPDRLCRMDRRTFQTRPPGPLTPAGASAKLARPKHITFGRLRTAQSAGVTRSFASHPGHRPPCSMREPPIGTTRPACQS